MSEPAKKEEKAGLPWGILLYVVLGAYALSFAAETLYAAKTFLQWLLEFTIKIAVPFAIILWMTRKPEKPEVKKEEKKPDAAHK